MTKNNDNPSLIIQERLRDLLLVTRMDACASDPKKYDPPENHFQIGLHLLRAAKLEGKIEAGEELS